MPDVMLGQLSKIDRAPIYTTIYKLDTMTNLWSVICKGHINLSVSALALTNYTACA